ncbi:hypothetical protein SETIT_8G201600v2 [Setaria italica]|uniref:Uncharacterized protein n=1 Tax=Setaria italica TaxID=4555 RepID=A0A368S9Q0_SETIT|nr:hypothetical protein SETIT_8G201600v2 [Setaria italica]
MPLFPGTCFVVTTQIRMGFSILSELILYIAGTNRMEQIQISYAFQTSSITQAKLKSQAFNGAGKNATQMYLAARTRQICRVTITLDASQAYVHQRGDSTCINATDRWPFSTIVLFSSFMCIYGYCPNRWPISLIHMFELS